MKPQKRIKEFNDGYNVGKKDEQERILKIIDGIDDRYTFKFMVEELIREIKGDGE